MNTYRSYDDDEYDEYRQELEDELYRDPNDVPSVLGNDSNGPCEQKPGRARSSDSNAQCTTNPLRNGETDDESEKPDSAALLKPGRASNTFGTLGNASTVGNYYDYQDNSDSVDSDVEERLWSSVAFSLDLTPPKSASRAKPPSSSKKASTTSGSTDADLAPGRKAADWDISGREVVNLVSGSDDETPLKSGDKFGSNDEESKYDLRRRHSSSTAGGRKARLKYTAASRSPSLTPSAFSGSEEVREALEVTKVIDLDDVAAPEKAVASLDAFEELETNEGYGRYFMPKKEEAVCARCKQKGHTMQKCKTPMCWNCGEIGHVDRACPNFIVMICRYCNRRGHRPENCKERMSGRPLDCARCGSRLHRSDECHFMWRIYVERPEVPAFREIEKWCYNCAQRGHYGDQCLEPRHREYTSSGRVESGFSDRHVNKRRRGDDSRPL